MYKVKKRFYDPILKGYRLPNEVIEIPEQHTEGYLPYVDLIETATVKEVVEIATPKEVIEVKKSPKKKVK